MYMYGKITAQLHFLRRLYFPPIFYVSNNNVSTSLVSLLTRVILTCLPRWLTHLPRWFAWLSMFVLLFNRKASVAGSTES